jgi:antitoxin (DNA-binding transcriptional repressor) of toxin-antitoxin stability system
MFMLMKLQEVSMVELRNGTEKILKGLRAGESYRLSYRGKPLARITPEPRDGQTAEDDPLYHFHELASEAQALTDAEMDASIYELR